MKLPRQVWLFTLSYALMLSGTSVLVLIAGIIGSQIAPSPELATLPIALAIVGLAINTLPATFLMKLWGRKKVFIGYGFLAILAALLASWSLTRESFVLFCCAATLMGASAAAVQQYRFAAIESVSALQIPKAASTVLLGGIVAAFIGPELALLGQHLLGSPFAGSFILLSFVYLLGIVVLSITRDSELANHESDSPGRKWNDLFRQPALLIAILAAAIGYGVMSFIMTATPLSMHNHYGHSLEDTKWVIQSHVAAMYLPSLFSGRLIERYGHYKMMAAGLVAFVLCLLIAYQSHTFWAFWSALVLLGIGWNFLFISGTALLPTAYAPEEKVKVQALNEVLVFSTQALAALTSGWLLYQMQWQGLLLLSYIPIVIVGLALLLRSWRNDSGTR